MSDYLYPSTTTFPSATTFPGIYSDGGGEEGIPARPTRALAVPLGHGARRAGMGGGQIDLDMAHGARRADLEG